MSGTRAQPPATSPRARSRRRFLGRCLAAAAGVLVLASCAAEPTGPDLVVLVSVSALRGDHLGSSGYPRPTSPFLDELAAGGAFFERAYASSPRAPLSLATLLTGLQPRDHGLWDSGSTLAPGIPTLAGLLAADGRTTAAFVSSARLFVPRGLDRGFAHVDVPPLLAELPYRPADRTVDAALAWLADRGRGGPTFLFVQLHDPERPFRAPPSYLPMVVEAASGPDYFAFLEREHGVPLGWYRWEHNKLNAVFNHYDAEVRFVDTELQRLREGIAALGRLEDTLFVVTASHGTGLGNHFWDVAGQLLYEEQVRVPLIFAAGDGSVAPRRIPDVVSHQDVLPTLLDLLGVGAEGAPADEPLAGRSLVPLLAGETLESRPARFERGQAIPLTQAQENQLARSPIPPPPGLLVGAVDRRWKLIDRDGPADELYDLEADPFERVNLLADGAEDPEQARPLRRALRGLPPLPTAPPAPKGDR